jgi:hypothetical protein
MDEQRWRPVQIAQMRRCADARGRQGAGCAKRFPSEELGRTLNGRVCEVIGVRGGDVVCLSIDERLSALESCHYPPLA